MEVINEFVKKNKEDTKKRVSLEINFGKSLFSSCIDFRVLEVDFFEKLSLIKSHSQLKEMKKNIYYEYFLNDLILHVFSDGSSFCYKNKYLKKENELCENNNLLSYELFEIENLPNDLFPSLLEYNLEKKNDSISFFFDGFIVNFICCDELEKYYQIKLIVNSSIKEKKTLNDIINLLKK